MSGSQSRGSGVLLAVFLQIILMWRCPSSSWRLMSTQFKYVAYNHKTY